MANTRAGAGAMTFEDEREELEERAAIMEYDGQLPREEAERRAREIVEKNRVSVPQRFKYE